MGYVGVISILATPTSTRTSFSVAPLAQSRDSPRGKKKTRRQTELGQLIMLSDAHEALELHLPRQVRKLRAVMSQASFNKRVNRSLLVFTPEGDLRGRGYPRSHRDSAGLNRELPVARSDLPKPCNFLAVNHNSSGMKGDS